MTVAPSSGPDAVIVLTIEEGRDRQTPRAGALGPGRRAPLPLAPLLAGIAAVGAAMRFATLDARSFWNDEAFTVLAVDGSFGGVLDAVGETENTPPLYYWLAWGWTRIFGLSEVGIRSLSALIGVLLIFVVFAIGLELFGRREALGAAALAAASPSLIWYSQDARAYELVALLGALSVLFFVRALDDRRGALPLWSATATLAIATHYYAVVLVAVQGVWLLAAHPRRAAVLVAGAPALAVGAALLPLISDQGAGDATSFIAELALAERVFNLWPVWWTSPATDMPLLPIPATLAALYAGWVLLDRAPAPQRRAAVELGGLVVGSVALSVVLSLAGVDFLLERNLIWLVPVLIVILAAGLASRAAGVVGPILLAGLCGFSIGIFAFTAGTPKYGEDWRDAAEALAPPPADPRILIVDEKAWAPLVIYLDLEDEAGTPLQIDPDGLGERLKLERGGELVMVTGGSGIAEIRSRLPANAKLRRAETIEDEDYEVVRFRAESPLRLDIAQIADPGADLELDLIADLSR